MSIWDDPEIRSNDNYVKFENVGDTVVGTILAVRKRTFEDGKVAPELIIRKDDGEEVTLTAGQVLLQRKLAEQRPEEGDRIAVRLDDIERRSGGKTLKHFTVQVERGAGPAPAPVAAAAAPAPAGGLL